MKPPDQEPQAIEPITSTKPVETAARPESEAQLLAQLEQAASAELGRLLDQYQVREEFIAEKSSELATFIEQHQRPYTPDQLRELAHNVLALPLGTDGVNPAPEVIDTWQLKELGVRISRELQIALGAEYPELTIAYESPPVHGFELRAQAGGTLVVDADSLEPRRMRYTRADDDAIDSAWQRAWEQCRTELVQIIQQFKDQPEHHREVRRLDGIAAKRLIIRGKGPSDTLSIDSTRWPDSVLCFLDKNPITFNRIASLFARGSYENPQPLTESLTPNVAEGDAAQRRKREIEDLKSGQRAVADAAHTLQLELRQYDSRLYERASRAVGFTEVERQPSFPPWRAGPSQPDKHLPLSMRSVIQKLQALRAPAGEVVATGVPLSAGAEPISSEQAERKQQLEELADISAALLAGPDRDHPKVKSILAQIDAVLALNNMASPAPPTLSVDLERIPEPFRWIEQEYIRFVPFVERMPTEQLHSLLRNIRARMNPEQLGERSKELGRQAGEIFSAITWSTERVEQLKQLPTPQERIDKLKAWWPRLDRYVYHHADTPPGTVLNLLLAVARIRAVKELEDAEQLGFQLERFDGAEQENFIAGVFESDTAAKVPLPVDRPKTDIFEIAGPARPGKAGFKIDGKVVRPAQLPYFVEQI